MTAQQQGWELLAPPAPYLLEQGLWDGRPGSTTSTNEQWHKEEKKTQQQFRYTQPLHRRFWSERQGTDPSSWMRTFMGSELGYPSWDLIRGLGPAAFRTITGPCVHKHSMPWVCISSGRQPKGQRVFHCSVQDRHLLCQPQDLGSTQQLPTGALNPSNTQGGC